MGKFIGLFGTRPPDDPRRPLQAGSEFLETVCRKSTVSQFVSSPNGHCTISETAVKGDTTLVHQDHRGLVVLDGKPHRGGLSIQPAEVLNSYFRLGVEELTADWDGSYAIAIFDNTNDRLVLVHDRFGLRPIYWTRSESGFLFATAAGALVRTCLVPLSTSPSAIARYASLNYRAAFGLPQTPFEGVSRLGPGEWLTINTAGDTTNGGGMRLDPEATYFHSKKEDLASSYYRECKSVLSELIQHWNPEDLVVSLSGGIDSGIILSLLKEICSEAPIAISMLYGQGEECERDLIELSADMNALRLIEHTLRPTDLIDRLPKIYQSFDLPISTVSIFAYTELFAGASNAGFNTILTGGSGDALQAGNYPYYLVNLLDVEMNDPKDFDNELAAWIRNHSTEMFPKSVEDYWRFKETAVDPAVDGRFIPHDMSLSPALLDRDFREHSGDILLPVVESYGTWMRTYIAQEYRYEIIPSAAETEATIDWINQSETVSPFLHSRLVDFGWRLPRTMRIFNGVNKNLARTAFARHLPDEIISTTHKRGFNAPTDQWFRNELRDFLLDHLNSSSFRERGIYDLTTLQQITDEHMSGDFDHRMVLWQALNLELWLREWLDR